MDFRVTFSNDLLSNVYTRFVPSKLIELSGKYFEDWDWVLFFTEGEFWSTLLNKNEVVILLMNEFVEPFCGVGAAFKPFVDK